MVVFVNILFGMKIRIKEIAARNKNWSLYKLAQELDVPQQTVYSWASGRTQPSYKNFERICLILDCTMNDLLEIEK